MELLTPRLRIRSFRREDLDAYAALVADAEVMQFLGGAQDRTQAAAYLDDLFVREAIGGVTRFAVERLDDGCFLGLCGYKTLLTPERLTDFGWRYTRASWGQGYGTEAAHAVHAYGRQTLGLRDISAGCAVANVGSLRIIERLGLPWRRFDTAEYGPEPDVRYYQRDPGKGAEYVAPSAAGDQSSGG